MAALVLLGSCFGNAAPGPGKDTRPNIIFILTDDQRWDEMSCMGHPYLKTPNMDRIRNEGVLFSNAFCTTSLCSPSRATFLTGTYAHTHGVINNNGREYDPVSANFTWLPMPGLGAATIIGSASRGRACMSTRCSTSTARSRK
ncbi:MAG: sulfatase-like hydrolase/transferase [Planctomycetota bacterium]